MILDNNKGEINRKINPPFPNKNQLLNYKPELQTVVIDNPLIFKVYEKLVMEKWELSIYPKILDNSINKSDLYNLSKIQKRLFTEYTKEALNKRIHSLNNKITTNLKETSEIRIYLVLGVLQWNYPEYPEILYKSPITFIPIRISPGTLPGIFQMQWTQEPIISNNLLRHILSNHQIQYPKLELSKSFGGIQRHFNRIENIIKPYSNWKILNEIFLDAFFLKRHTDKIRDEVPKVPTVAGTVVKTYDNFPFVSIFDFINFFTDKDWSTFQKWQHYLQNTNDLDRAAKLWNEWKVEEKRREDKLNKQKEKDKIIIDSVEKENEKTREIAEKNKRDRDHLDGVLH